MTASPGVAPRLYRPPKRPSIVVLLMPLHDEDVLVPREVYFYKRRAHWTAVVPHTVEALSIVALAMVVLARTVPTGSTILLTALVVAGLTVWRMIKQRDWTWTDQLGLGIGAVLVISAGVGLRSLAVLAALWAMLHLGLQVVRWRFYETRYITNRRIVEISGLLGRRISSMPLHQVTDITLNRSVAGELLQYGELRIESAGQDQALGTIPHLIEDERFHDILVHLATREARTGGRD